MGKQSGKQQEMATKKDTGGEEFKIEEEFSNWMSNTHLLYDLVISHNLEWPSLTVQWLPSTPSLDGSFALHKLILGTHTSDDSPNFLLLAQAHLPLNPLPDFETELENFRIPKVEIIQKIHVDGEVNRARCMPQVPSIIAAKTSSSDIYVFDSTKQPLDHKGGSCKPDVKLRGHDKEGYGLSWNPFKKGYLLSGSNDGKICLWDVSKRTAKKKVLKAIHIYEDHESIVEDVSWHSMNESLFGSVGDDCKLMIWDVRTNKHEQAVVAHKKEVNYLAFNPFNEWILATASSDTTVGLFDMRKLKAPLHVLCSHTGEVFQVEWDPNHETVLASSADDRRVKVWDISRIGDERVAGESEDGPSELLFAHGGHTEKISDFSWNKNEPRVISSVNDDNTLQVWQMVERIYQEDDY